MMEGVGSVWEVVINSWYVWVEIKEGGVDDRPM